MIIFVVILICPMRKIQMVDLYGQYLKLKSEIDKAILEVIESSAFIRGPEVRTFEQELAAYLNIEHAVSCANGTDALQVSLMALDLKPGDEVISPDFTFGATVEVIALLGLKPVLVDVDPDHFNINTDLIIQSISPKTKAIIPVHLFGQCAEMETILEIADEHELFVIEDSAQALSADFIYGKQRKKAGTLGHIGCTSFFPSKNLGCYGDGGAIFTHDEVLAMKLSAITRHGTYVKYHHDLIGVNSRLDTLQAAILRIKLRYLDEYSESRQKVADFYDRALGKLEGIEIPSRVDYSTHVFHQYTLKLNGIKREAFMNHLKSKGIPTMIYYPVPLHLQKAFHYLGYRKGAFPVTESLCENVVSLPMHTEMDDEQLEFITGTIASFINNS